MPGQFTLIPASASQQMEATMSRVITFDKGSKRRLRQIRWKRFEIASLILIALFILTITGFSVFLEMAHGSFEPDTPHLRDRR
jgi:hypothetical protein